MKLDDIYKTVEAWDKEIKKELSETASASINMSGDNAEDVIKLMNALKGAPQADSMDKMPVAIKKGPEMEPVDSMAKLRDLVKGPEQGPMDKPEPMDMKIPMKIDAEADEVVPEEEWDNSPDEDYKDANYMTKTLSGGSEQGVKKSYPKVAGGDNPMALEDEIRAELSAALAEKMQDVAETDCGCDTHENHDDCNDDCPPHSVNEAKEGKMPSKAECMKMCKDGMSKAEICKKYPDCDQDKLKEMIDGCMKEMKESVEEGKFKKTGKDGDGAFDESGCVGEMKKLKASGCAKHEMYDKVAEKYGCSKGQFEKLYASNCG
tara:strand:+ start:3942 stop:4898 length:957 start_codon:yes stop_codon:yes gene_type:complete